MANTRAPGMDQPYYGYSAITDRRPLRWPGDRPVALLVILCAEHYDWAVPPGAFATAAGGIPFQHAGLTDVRTYSHREYANRVGIFRVMEVLDKHGIRATLAVDSTVASEYPIVIDAARQRDYEFICHGVAVTRLVTSRMTEEEERAYIRESVDAVSGCKR